MISDVEPEKLPDWFYHAHTVLARMTKDAYGEITDDEIRRVLDVSEKINSRYKGVVLKAVKRSFEDDKSYVMATLQAEYSFQLQAAKSLNWDGLLERLRDYFSSVNSWLQNILSATSGLVAEHVNTWANVLNENAGIATDIAYGNALTQGMTELVERNNEASIATLEVLIRTATDEGWSYEKTRNSTNALYGYWKDGTETDLSWSEKRITERARTMRDLAVPLAANIAAVESAKEWDYSLKAWITMQDDKVRPAHIDAHGQTVPVDMPFVVMGEALMFPGDPRGSLANIINCRCVVTMKKALT